MASAMRIPTVKYTAMAHLRVARQVRGAAHVEPAWVEPAWVVLDVHGRECVQEEEAEVHRHVPSRSRRGRVGARGTRLRQPRRVVVTASAGDAAAPLRAPLDDLPRGSARGTAPSRGLEAERHTGQAEEAEEEVAATSAYGGSGFAFFA